MITLSDTPWKRNGIKRSVITLVSLFLTWKENLHSLLQDSVIEVTYENANNPHKGVLDQTHESALIPFSRFSIRHDTIPLALSLFSFQNNPRVPKNGNMQICIFAMWWREIIK